MKALGISETGLCAHGLLGALTGDQHPARGMADNLFGDRADQHMAQTRAAVRPHHDDDEVDGRISPGDVPDLLQDVSDDGHLGSWSAPGAAPRRRRARRHHALEDVARIQRS